MSYTRPEGLSSFCQIAGCTDPAVEERWVVVGEGDKAHLEVCYKHTTGEIDPATIEPKSD